MNEPKVRNKERGRRNKCSWGDKRRISGETLGQLRTIKKTSGCARGDRGGSITGTDYMKRNLPTLNWRERNSLNVALYLPNSL